MSYGVGRRSSSDLAPCCGSGVGWRLQPYSTPSLRTIMCLRTGPRKGKKTEKKIFLILGVPIVAQWLANPTRNHEVAGSIPGLAQWVKDPALP